MYSEVLPQVLNSILHYVHKLESSDCVCSNMWERHFIKYFSIIVIFKILLFPFWQIKICKYVVF